MRRREAATSISGSPEKRICTPFCPAASPSSVIASAVSCSVSSSASRSTEGCSSSSSRMAGLELSWRAMSAFRLSYSRSSRLLCTITFEHAFDHFQGTAGELHGVQIGYVEPGRVLGIAAGLERAARHAAKVVEQYVVVFGDAGG